MTSLEPDPATGSPSTADEFIALAESTPGLVNKLRDGDLDAFVEYFELAPGAEVTEVTTRELAR